MWSDKIIFRPTPGQYTLAQARVGDVYAIIRVISGTIEHVKTYKKGEVVLMGVGAGIAITVGADTEIEVSFALANVK